MIKKVGQFIKHFLGAYKYAITQTFAIPTIDDAEKGNVVEGANENNEEEGIVNQKYLNDEKIEQMLENPSLENFDSIFKLSA